MAKFGQGSPRSAMTNLRFIAEREERLAAFIA